MFAYGSLIWKPAFEVRRAAALRRMAGIDRSA
ncbi:hypothetical protein ACVOMV_21110 [Mesorhizobium atlanticum]